MQNYILFGVLDLVNMPGKKNFLLLITLLLVLHKPSNQKVAILVGYLLYNNSIITNALLLQYLYPYINYLPLRSSIRPGVRLAQAEKPSFGRFCHSPGQNCSLFV